MNALRCCNSKNFFEKLNLSDKNFLNALLIEISFIRIFTLHFFEENTILIGEPKSIVQIDDIVISCQK